MDMDTDRFRVRPGNEVRLGDRDPGEDGGLDKTTGKERTEVLRAELETLQEMLYVDGRHKVLVILQAIDAGGKDGTIRAVFDGVNPQGVSVTSFKKPSSEELAHDYFWRVHQHTPRNGHIEIFNRSHYEDVLVVRVHQLVPEERWRKRYGHIRAFEQMLVDEGTTIIKFFLHVSKEEQLERQQERIDDPTKRWKFDPADIEQRKHWDGYHDAFEAMLRETSTEQAPWFVIPANRNWFRNLLVSQIMVEKLRALELRYPEPELDLDGLVLE